ncbi:hypothetical protein MRX96_051646 [Rhipicephalus microplus]
MLTYAGSMCQWPYEYRFYDECGLTTHDVYVILGIQQLAVLLGPYLVAWLGSRKTTRPASKVYASMLVWAVTGLLVDVCGWGVEWVYSLASALYVSALLVVLLGVDGRNDMEPSILPGVATAREARQVPELVLRRVALLLEDTATLTTCTARFLLEAVAVLNRAVFEMTGPFPCGRMVTSLACIDVVASSFAVVSQMSGTKATLMSACGTSICMSAFASAYCYTAPARPEFCAGHAFLSFGTTLATAGNFTPPRHRSALAGKSRVVSAESMSLLASAILLWPRDDPDAEFAILVGWMSSLTIMAFSILFTGYVVSYWCPTAVDRRPLPMWRHY